MSLFVQHLRDGNNTHAQKQRLINQISNLIIDDKHEYTWTMTKYDKSKTKAQLGYYWGVVIPEMMRWQGSTSKECDQALKEELLPPKIITIFEQAREVRPSIADMKVKEMSEYIDICVSFLGTWGVFVPPAPYKENL